VEEVGEDDILMAAVPKAATFSRLAGEWGDRPLMRRVGIRIVLVGRDGGRRGTGPLDGHILSGRINKGFIIDLYAYVPEISQENILWVRI
jgi:hypothetical protein